MTANERFEKSSHHDELDVRKRIFSFTCQAGNPPNSGGSPQRKSRSYKGEVVRLKGL